MTIKKLPSGFYSVWANGVWINAALPSEEAAREYIQTMEKSSNRREEGHGHRSPTK